MEERPPEHESFINRKRPALEGLVQHIIGPAAILDQELAGKPVFPNEDHEIEPEVSKEPVDS